MRIAKQLTDAQVRAIKRRGFHAVGGVPGLLIQVSDTGAKSWVFRATVAGQIRSMGLGAYAEKGLAEAREEAMLLRSAIREGRNPVAERKAKKRALQDATERALTFKQATELYYRKKKSGELRSKRNTWLRSMELYCYPVIGDKLVAEIDRRDAITVLEPTWPRPSTVALRGRIENVLDWSAVRGYRDENVPNPAAWKTLKHVLSKPSKSHKVNHHPALPWQEAATFMRELRASTDELGVFATAALEVCILTASRSGEVRGATWEEFDLDEGVWTVPEERIKAGLTHRVPLCERAIEVLENVAQVTGEGGSGLVFPVPSKRRGGLRPLYDYEVLNPCREIAARLGFEATVHGWRSSFKDWCRTCTGYADEVSELALAHVSSDATRAAYARDELLDKRRRLMDEWSEYLTHGLPTAEVVGIGSRRKKRA